FPADRQYPPRRWQPVRRDRLQWQRGAHGTEGIQARVRVVPEGLLLAARTPPELPGAPGIGGQTERIAAGSRAPQASPPLVRDARMRRSRDVAATIGPSNAPG